MGTEIGNVILLVLGLLIEAENTKHENQTNLVVPPNITLIYFLGVFWCTHLAPIAPPGTGMIGPVERGSSVAATQLCSRPSACASREKALGLMIVTLRHGRRNADLSGCFRAPPLPH